MAPAGPPDDRCRVYLARASGQPAPADLALLDRGEREECERLATPALRALFACRRALLRRRLGAALDLPPAALRLCRDAGGRLRLEPPLRAAGPPPPDFSLSASGDLAAVAIATRGRVGVDVEQCRDDVDREALLARYATEAERNWLQARYGGARRDGFFRLWALKEAWSKALGTGLAARLDAVTLIPLDDGGVEADLGAVSAKLENWSFSWRSLPGPAVVAVAWRCAGRAPGRPEFESGAGEWTPSGGHSEPLEEGVRRCAQAGDEQHAKPAQQQYRGRR